MTLAKLLLICPEAARAEVFSSDPLSLDDWHTTYLVLTHKNDDVEGGSIAPLVKALLEAEEASGARFGPAPPPSKPEGTE